MQPLASGMNQNERFITPERLAPFRAATDGNIGPALRLYRWNVQLSGAMYEVLHYAEVILRNSINERLATWNDQRGHGVDWTLTTDPLLEDLLNAKGQHLDRAWDKAWEAVNKPQRAETSDTTLGIQPKHCDVIPALSLGTWVTLLPGSGRDARKTRLWDEALKYAFSQIHLSSASKNRGGLTRDARRMLDMRNRVAHLEPLLDTTKVNEAFGATQRCLYSIDDSAAKWAMSTQRVKTILAARPK